VKLVDCLMLERVVFGNGERLKQSLNVLHKKKRAMRFGRCLWPTIEEKKLREWVVNERAKCMRISTVRVLQ
jgi:hypothetical protein